MTKNKEWKDKAVFLATQARENAVEYHHKAIGYNYRMSNVLAGIGRGQMEVLDDRVAARRKVYQSYELNLKDIEEISFLNEPEYAFSNRWLSAILLPSEKIREELRLALLKQNIESRPLWKPMHIQPVFEAYPSYLNGVSEELFNKGLCLPSGSNLTENELNRVISAIKTYFRA